MIKGFRLMHHVATKPVLRSLPFAISCEGLTVEFPVNGGLRVAQNQFAIGALKNVNTKSARVRSICPIQTRLHKTRVLTVAPGSGPLFVYTNPEQTGQDHGVNSGLCVIRFDHHEKMDDAENGRRINQSM